MVKRERGKERTKKCHDTPATRGDLRVLKKNFFKLTFIAALCSAPKSKSFWHVMNIGHIITAPAGGGGGGGTRCIPGWGGAARPLIP